MCTVGAWSALALRYFIRNGRETTRRRARSVVVNGDTKLGMTAPANGQRAPFVNADPFDCAGQRRDRL